MMPPLEAHAWPRRFSNKVLAIRPRLGSTLTIHSLHSNMVSSTQFCALTYGYPYISVALLVSVQVDTCYGGSHVLFSWEPCTVQLDARIHAEKRRYVAFLVLLCVLIGVPSGTSQDHKIVTAL